MNELHLFAGAGGGILAGQLLGRRCVCAVEWEPYAQAVLVARQNDGTFPPFPIWDDVRTFDGRPWRGIVVTWWLEASPARTSVQQEPAPASTASAADSGQRWQGSFAKYDPERSSWRTPQCSLLGDSDEFSETWPRWGSMRNGVSYLRPIPALPICESGSGLWPTPCASASKGSSPAALVRKNGRSRENDRIDHAVMASDGGQLNPEWVEWLMGWPIGHTALKPLETAKYREWQQQHGIYFQEKG